MVINEKHAIIIPVHKLSTTKEFELFQNAVDSVFSQKTLSPKQLVIVTGDKESGVLAALTEQVGTTRLSVPTGVKVDVVTREKGANLNFQAQVNAGVANLFDSIEYFTVLEFDDTLRKNYSLFAEAYTDAYPDASVFLPLVEEVNAEGQLLKYSNEVLWAPSFVEQLGVLDHEALTGFANFHLTGAVIKKADFLEAGGLKESMELTFNYEFLLRVTQLGKEVRSIPKVIYTHLDARPGSLFLEYTNGKKALSSEEVRFWFDTAQKECVFTEDRKIVYSPA